MNDDWRLQVDLHDESHLSQLAEWLEARELEHDLSDAFHDRIVVSRDGATVLLYAGTREQIESAREAIVRLDEEHGWDADLDLKRWHPLAERWEGADKPLPDGDEAEDAEREALMAAEREQAESGHPEFEVRADLPSRRDAQLLAEQLRDEGLPTARRWKYLLVGAEDEDSAQALAERIRADAPSGSSVDVEGTWRAAYDQRPSNPFAILGGLGG